MSAPISISREELYEQIWNEPVTKIATKYGVSDVAIAKICKKLNVPRPPRGYWARKHHGYPTVPQPLPQASKDTQTEYLLIPPGKPSVSRERIEPPIIEVSDRLERPHEVIRALRSDLKGSRADDFGRIGRSDGPMHLSKEIYARACRVLDTLFKALQSRAHSVTYEDKQICLLIEGEIIHLAASEPTRRIELERDKWGYRRWVFEPTGKLILTLSSRYLSGVRKQWSDGKVQKLENLLGRLIVALEQAPAVIKVARDEADRYEREWQRQQLRSRREREVVRLSHERAKFIDQISVNWQKANRLRVFVTAVEEANDVSVALHRQARWARLYADHLDPLQNFELVSLTDGPARQMFWREV